MVTEKGMKTLSGRSGKKKAGKDLEVEGEAPDEMLVAIGQRISTLRKAQRMTQRELGERVGLTLSSIYLVERGLQNSTIISLRRFASALGVTVGALLPDDQRVVSVNRELLLSWCDGIDDLAESFGVKMEDALKELRDTAKLFRDIGGGSKE